MISSLAQNSDDNMEFVVPDGGYFISVKLNDDIETEVFYDELEKRHIGVIPGNVVSAAGSGYEQYFRLNFTLPTLSEIKTGMERISEAAAVAKQTKFPVIGEIGIWKYYFLTSQL